MNFAKINLFNIETNIEFYFLLEGVWM